MSKPQRSNSPQPSSLVDDVVQAVLEYIKENQLRVGDPILSEVEFTRRLAVSRTVVREAFKTLTAMKIIEAGSGRRARVSVFDGSVMATILAHALRTEQLTPQQIWDVRRSIERRSVVLACMHRSERDAERLLDLAHKMRDSYADVTATTEYDIEFHVAIAEATPNPLLPVLISSLTAAMRETNPIVWTVRNTDELKLEVVGWHETIANAIREKNIEAAEDAIARHFDKATSELVNAGFN